MLKNLKVLFTSIMCWLSKDRFIDPFELYYGFKQYPLTQEDMLVDGEGFNVLYGELSNGGYVKPRDFRLSILRTLVENKDWRIGRTMLSKLLDCSVDSFLFYDGELDVYSIREVERKLEERLYSLEHSGCPSGYVRAMVKIMSCVDFKR